VASKKLKQLGLTFQEKILKRYFVRWHMSAILAATIGSGLLLDKLFLFLGLGGMGFRYALSVLGAYGVFFLLVRMWVWYAAGVAVTLSLPGFSDDSRSSGSSSSLPDFGGIGGGSGGGGDVGFSGFQGGDAGGGGASDLFDSPVVSTGGGGGGSGLSLDLDLDLDDGFWILIILAILIAIICGAGAYLIWMAPEILPDIALECAVGAGLVRHLKNPEAGWAGRLLWKTWIPLAIVMVAAFFAGAFIQSNCPGATHARAALHCAVTQ
jgi:hypothetical protein